MGKQMQYTLTKLSEINYRMAIHKGDANQRLTSEAENIINLILHEIPTDYRSHFDKLTDILTMTLNDRKSFLLKPYKIYGIRNETCSKYLALLIDIEDSLRQMRNEAREIKTELDDKPCPVIIIDDI
jgi:hypothetical protein